MRRAFVAGLLVVVALGCSAKKRPVIPPEQLWAEGNQAFEDEAWERVADRFKLLLDQHPFDANAEEAELKIAQAHYFGGRYAEAIAAFGDFERMHPTSDNLAVVEYHLGLAYLGQASTPDRDQQVITNALTYFQNVTDRFPQSPWAEKAKLRQRECREVLAAREHYVASYYLRHANLRAAEVRLRDLLTEYPDTEAAAAALHTFADAYASRNESEGATLALATLVRHHPDGPLAADARRQLGDGSPYLAGPDPLQMLVGHIDAMSGQSERKTMPRTVSAYPDSVPSGRPSY